MLEWAIFYALAIPVAIAFATYYGVKKMAARPSLEARADLAAGLIGALPADKTSFLNANGFRFAEAYAFHLVRIGIWTRTSDQMPTQSFSYSRTATNSTYEFITEFSDDVSLTTTMSRAAFMFPRGFGGFLQSFPKASIVELWDAHLKGEAHVRSTLSLPISQCKLPYEERVSRGMTKQLAYVRSLSFWPIRGIYWFTIKRFLMSNRPIWKQDIASIYKTHPEAPLVPA